MYRKTAEEILEDSAGGIEFAAALIALALSDVALQLKYLGNGDASTHMGAIEALGKKIGETGDNIASAIGESARVE